MRKYIIYTRYHIQCMQNREGVDQRVARDVIDNQRKHEQKTVLLLLIQMRL